MTVVATWGLVVTAAAGYALKEAEERVLQADTVRAKSFELVDG